MAEQSIEYFVYMVECSDGTFYTGICRDVEKRLKQHNASTQGAKYTRSRRPVRLAYAESHPDKSSALRREYQLRHYDRIKKQGLISGWKSVAM